uniref:Uncharacterized protein n=1 Tax=Odontella aurita TaxID=265563 RepID=A0A7S4MA35_9STRA
MAQDSVETGEKKPPQWETDHFEIVDEYRANSSSVIFDTEHESSANPYTVEYQADSTRGLDHTHTNALLVFPALSRIIECSTDDESGSETHQCKVIPCPICDEAKKDLLLFRVYTDEASV